MSNSALPARLNVLMAGSLVGHLERLPTGAIQLTYADAWRAAEQSHVPLSLSLPLTAATHRGKAVENYLWNLLPDNADTLTAWGKAYGVSHRNAFALLSKVGDDCAGAVQFVTDEWMSANGSAPGEVAYIDDKEVAARLKRLRVERTWTGRRSTDKGHFSLAGAQPKMALYYGNDVWGIPSGRMATTHILKPPMPNHSGTTENEYACLRLAAALGLRTSEVAVRRFEDEAAIVVTRYDRTMDRHGRVRRYHQEDLCQTIGVHPDGKYEKDGGPGAEAISRVLWQTTEGEAAVKAFSSALALNFLIGGTDGHAKNYSIVHAAGRKSYMAPLYDVLSYFPYVDDPAEFRDLKMAMKLGGYYEFDKIMPRHWERQAKAMRLDPEEMVSVVSDMANRLPDELSAVKRHCEEVGLGHVVLDTMLDVASRRCERVNELYGVQAAPAP